MDPSAGRIKPDDDWTGVTARNERKKRQNRLNQRALRNRKRTEEHRIIPWRLPYRMDRWRISMASDHESQPSTETPNFYLTPKEQVDGNTNNTVLYSRRDQLSDMESAAVGDTGQNSRHSRCPESAPFIFPLSSDHLLHLVHYNVLRALHINKSILNDTTHFTKPSLQDVITIFPSTVAICDGFTIIHPPGSTQSLPQSLYPTPLQMSQAHASWINNFPFPRLRDNLIQYEDTFDSFELLYDLFGELITTNLTFPSHTSTFHSIDVDEDDIAARKNGLIVWGESWDIGAWELTPGFVRKWGLLLDGCEELIEITNRWRATRGEESLRLDNFQ